MNKVTKQYRTETGHRLSDYNGKCSHFHGHSYLWEVTVEAEHLSNNGMVVDFKDLKKAMVEVLEPLDHAMVLYHLDPIVAEHEQQDLYNIFRATNGANPRLLIWPVNPTAENFALWASLEIQKLLPVSKTVTRVRVWETANSCATWELE